MSDLFEDSIQPTGFIVRESRRARHVNLRYSVKNGLEIVVPIGYDQSRIPEVLEQKKKWLQRTRLRIQHERSRLPAEHFEILPRQIELLAIGAVYEIEYNRSHADNVCLTEQDNVILIEGNIADTKLCANSLDKWLRHTAKKHLPPWLRRTSHELKLPYEKTSVRGQKTRWGSCSSLGTISLNYKLLFLPGELVHYLFVHELCHTRHMNHSRKFWSLVEEKYPEYRTAEYALKTSSRYLPLWLKD